MLGDLTLTAGEYNTLSGDSGGDLDLTVTGDVIIAAAGTLTCNTSTVIVDSITISANGTLDAPDASGSLTLNGTKSAWSFQNNSTNFNHNNGTITQTAAGHIKSVSSNPMYNFTLNSATSDSHEAVFRPKTGTDCVIAANNVTVTRGVVKLNTVSHNASMGSLTIGSAGTFQASSGTTTLTGGGANGDNAASLNGEGTFTHNNGTLHFATGAQYRIPNGGTFYNVTADVHVYAYSSTLLPQPTMPDGTTASDFISILGTLRINNQSFNPYNADGLYVRNLIIGDDTGSANTAKISLAESNVFNGNVFVDNVTIHSDGQFLFGDGDEPQSSTLNIYGAFRNLGGNVTIE